MRKAPDFPAFRYLFAAWVVAMVATLSALFIGEVMGRTPCNLCWFQRVFMFPLAVILPVALLRNEGVVWAYTLPLAVIGGLIALFHSLLYAGMIPEATTPCGQGPSCSSADMMILDVFPLPMLSLLAFATVAVLLFLVRRKAAR